MRTNPLSNLASTIVSTIVAIALAAGLVTVTAPIASAQAGGASERLLRAATEDGAVPVIVTLDVDVQPEYELAGGEVGRQRAAIAKAQAQLIHDVGGRTLGGLKTYAGLPLIAFHATPADLEALAASDAVASVQEDIVLEPTGRPSSGADDLTGSGSPMGTSSNGASNQLAEWWDWDLIDVDKSKNKGYTGKGQVVAVIDTGTQANHAWLSSNMLFEACFVTLTSGAGGCAGGTKSVSGPGAGAPCTYSTICAHGTHTAHTAAGKWGVAPAAKIVAIQASHPEWDTKLGAWVPKFYWSDIVAALWWVYELRVTHGYKVAAVNMSVGGGWNPAYCDTHNDMKGMTNVIGWLAYYGVASVISTGNDNYSDGIGMPACVKAAIAVGNTTYDTSGYDAVYGNVKGGSNSDDTVDLLAPGTDICSAVPIWADAYGNKSDGMDCGWTGTSMAAPHVAGAIAVLRAYKTSASIGSIVNALHASGVGVTDSRNGVVRSRINVWNALGRI